MNGLRFIDPGLLDRHAVLEENVGAPDAMGGTGTRWHELAELNAHLEPLGARVRERFDRAEATITHRVTMRHRDDVRHGMALRFGSRRLRIVKVADPDERRRWLVCSCEEEP